METAPARLYLNYMDIEQYHLPRFQPYNFIDPSISLIVLYNDQKKFDRLGPDTDDLVRERGKGDAA